MTCPRCTGPTTLEEDQYGVYRSCLCCGWLQEAGPPDHLPLDLPTPRKPRGAPFNSATGRTAARKPRAIRRNAAL